jgi:hypothetical protein
VLHESVSGLRQPGPSPEYADVDDIILVIYVGLN